MYFGIALAAGVCPSDRIGREVLFIFDGAAYLPLGNGVVRPIHVHVSEIYL